MFFTRLSLDKKDYENSEQQNHEGEEDLNADWTEGMLARRDDVDRGSRMDLGKAMVSESIKRNDSGGAAGKRAKRKRTLVRIGA